MINEDDFAVASEDSPEMAFVRLERKFRAAFESNIETSNSGGAYDHYRAEYMNHTVAAAKALDLPIFRDFDVPNENSDDMSELYRTFRRVVDEFIVHTQIAHVRSGPRNSVALDPSEKKHLRAYADKIKEIIDKSSLRADKKERLFDKINAFIAELDKDRTPLDRFNDVVLSLAHTGGDAAEELEPAWKWVKLAAAILGVRQETEQTKLPAPPKKLKAPKRQLPPPPQKVDRFDMNDEVPF